jgi:ribosomal protein S18 acetylase RimI-like enzyme
MRSDHLGILAIARTSQYTKDFGNEVMFSGPVHYDKEWIRVCIDASRPQTPPTILGFTCFRVKVRAPKVKLYFLGVAPDHFREGVATRLVADLQEQLPATHPMIELSCARDNEAALQLYTKLGFAIVASDENYYFMERRKF